MIRFQAHFLFPVSILLLTATALCAQDIAFARLNQRAASFCVNDGSGIFPDSNCDLIQDVTNAREVAIADVDGGTGPDLIFATGSYNQVCLNDGSGNFTCSNINTDQVNTQDVAVADVDGDNDPDLILANEPGSGGPGENQVCLNDGSGNFICSYVSSDTFRSLGVAVADVDGDNDPDLIFANFKAVNRVCLNDGSGSFTCSNVSTDALLSEDVAVADVDGANGPDLIFSNTSSSSVPGGPQANRVCLNDGSGSFTCSDVSADLNDSRGVTVADFDGLNGPDLAFANRVQANRVCLNDGSGGFSCAALTASNAYAVEAADFDGLNGPDLVFADMSRSQVCLNDGSANFNCTNVSNTYAKAGGSLGLAVGGDLINSTGNAPPTVDAGTSYGGDEGSSITLDGATASDPDGDPLTYAWSVDSPLCSFSDDSVLNPDLTCADNGIYTVTLTVDDGTADPVSSGATVTVNNVAPTIESLIVPGEPIDLNNQAAHNVEVTFSDPAGANDEEYQCDFDMDNDGSTDESVTGVTGTLCSTTLSYAEAGVYKVKVTVTDDDGDSGTNEATSFIVVYDPSAGFVTGRGWIDSPPGAYAADPGLTGRANFGFVSKYKKGTTTQVGQTQFRFKAGDLDFHSTDYEWLVVAGAKAMFKGTGTINSTGVYSFQINAIDGQVNGGGGEDKFRIKIKSAGGGVIYDNQPGAGDNDDPTTTLGGGSIKIHSGGANKAEAGETAAHQESEVPDVFALHQNYPNPFNPTTAIHFAVPERSEIQVIVYDMVGREVKRLVDGAVAAGEHVARFDATGLPSGQYLVRMVTLAGTFTRPIQLVK